MHEKSASIILIIAVTLTSVISIASACLVIDDGGIDWAAKTRECVITVNEITRNSSNEKWQVKDCGY